MTRCGRCRRCECAGAPTTTTHGDVVRNRDNDAPDAVLESLAMAGLVAILRQLGDLAELAAEVFDDMQDQVMAASARGQRLAVRARKLLAADLDLDLPQPSTQEHRCLRSAAAALATSGGAGRLDFRSHLVGTPPMPLIVVQRIERCRGPPRLSLLDKFDAAGEGACLKRYTDPSFFSRAHSAKLEQGMLKQHRRQAEAAAGAGSLFRVQQTSVHRVDSSPQQLNMEQKLQEGGTAQPSPSELERTSSFEAWLSPEARRFPTATTTSTTHRHLQEPSPDDDDGATTCSGGSVSSHVVTTSNAAALSSSGMVKARHNSASEVKGGGESNTTRSRYKGSVDRIASRVSSLPRKLFMNTTKHHNDRSRSYRAGSSLRMSQAGDCSPGLEAIAIPTPDADRCSNSKSSTPDTCTATENLLLPGSNLVLERPDKSSSSPSSEDAKVDTPLAPIPPMQWLSEKGTPPASPKHRTPCFQQQFGSSGHSDDNSSNLQQESVFFSAAQELAKMSPPPPPPPPWVPRPKYPLLDVKLRNGPSPIHPSRNILDSRSAQSSKLKPASGASSHGSPTNILDRADDIRQVHDDGIDQSWSGVDGTGALNLYTNL